MFLINFQVFRSTQVFPCEDCKIVKSNCFEEHLRTVASEDQVYSNTRVSTRVNTSQHESTQVNTNQHEPEMNQHESDTSQHESTQVQHESTQINSSPTRVNTNQHESKTSLDHKK